MIKSRQYTHVLSMLMTLCFSASTWANMHDRDLISAAASGNLSRVKALLVAKADVNAQTDNGTTALIAASENGYEGRCKREDKQRHDCIDAGIAERSWTGSARVACRQSQCECQQGRWCYGIDAGVTGGA
jgi:hypothetical protein